MGFGGELLEEGKRLVKREKNRTKWSSFRKPIISSTVADTLKSKEKTEIFF